jgi:hypothetical protein
VSRKIREVDSGAEPEPDYYDDPAEPRAGEASEVPAGGPHKDYDDEVPSQRRLRWMTQVLVMPALLPSLWGLACGVGWLAGLAHCGAPLSNGYPLMGFVGVLLPLALWLIWRRKIGARRGWVNVVLLAVLLPLGAWNGWHWAQSSSECPGWVAP